MLTLLADAAEPETLQDNPLVLTIILVVAAVVLGALLWRTIRSRRGPGASEPTTREGTGDDAPR